MGMVQRRMVGSLAYEVSQLRCRIARLAACSMLHVARARCGRESEHGAQRQSVRFACTPSAPSVRVQTLQ